MLNKKVLAKIQRSSSFEDRSRQHRPYWTEQPDTYATIKKVLMVDYNRIKVKYQMPDGTVKVALVDLGHSRENILYQRDGLVPVDGLILEIHKNPMYYDDTSIIWFCHAGEYVRGREIIVDRQYFPLYLASGETDSDEPVTNHITFPPPETTDQWYEWVQPQITQLARAVAKGTSHNLPHLTGKKEDKCSDLDTTHPRAMAYENCANMCGGCIGYIQRELDKHVASYKEYAKAKSINPHDDPFELPTGLLTRDEIETLLTKVQAKINIESVENFQLFHDHEEWFGVHEARRIHLPNDDENMTHGELIYNVKDQHTEGSPELQAYVARSEFHSICTDHFDRALHSRHYEPITERIITVS